MDNIHLTVIDKHEEIIHPMAVQAADRMGDLVQITVVMVDQVADRMEDLVQITMAMVGQAEDRVEDLVQ